LKSFYELYSIAKQLRSDKGCPWDKSRKISDLVSDFAEEAEEIKQAVQNEDNDNLKEEIGDTLFTLILMSIIAEEEGLFDWNQVCDGIKEKLISRHTWVFGDDTADTAEEALALWKKNKEKEKKKA